MTIKELSIVHLYYHALRSERANVTRPRGWGDCHGVRQKAWVVYPKVLIGLFIQYGSSNSKR